MSRGIHDVTLGLRSDDNETYGTNTTGNVAWGITVADNTRLVTSWGNAFKAPTFNDLYWPDGANPNLKPEESETIEVSLSNSQKDISWQASMYQTQIDNMIEWAPLTTPPFNWAPSNIEKADISGLELSVSKHIETWLISSSFTAIDPTYTKTVNGTNDGNTLVNRVTRSLKLDADKSWGALDVGLSWVVENSRYQDKANKHETAGYGLLNLRTAYNISDELKVQFKIDNVLDKEYVTKQYSYYDAFFNQIYENYNTLGRAAFISVIYTPSF